MTLSLVAPSSERRATKPAAQAALPKGPLVALFIASLMSNLLMLTGPLFMLQVYDRVLASHSLPTLGVLTALICALYAFYAFIEASIGTRLLAAAVHLKLIANSPVNADPVRDGDALRHELGGRASRARRR